MRRLLFEKKGCAVWISHLDLMRLFQRAFKRAGFPLTHTQGYNPRPSVSIALPLSVGVESVCELLDFELDGVDVSSEQISWGLNENLVSGIRVLEVYDGGAKLRDLSYLDCTIRLEYDHGVPNECVSKITHLLNQDEVLVEKKSKNGITEQNIVSMIRQFQVSQQDNDVVINARICCQNPSLNPAQIVAAITKYRPEIAPDFSWCSRQEIYNQNMEIFR